MLAKIASWAERVKYFVNFSGSGLDRFSEHQSSRNGELQNQN